MCFLLLGIRSAVVPQTMFNMGESQQKMLLSPVLTNLTCAYEHRNYFLILQPLQQLCLILVCQNSVLDGLLIKPIFAFSCLLFKVLPFLFHVFRLSKPLEIQSSSTSFFHCYSRCVVRQLWTNLGKYLCQVMLLRKVVIWPIFQLRRLNFHFLTRHQF